MVESNNFDKDDKLINQKSPEIMEAQLQINQAEHMNEESARELNNSWRSFISKQDDIFKGAFHICESLYNEQQLASKKLYSRGLLSKSKQNTITKSCIERKIPKASKNIGTTHQSFIPNKITYSFEGIGSRIYNANFDNPGEKFYVTSQSGTAIFDFTTDNLLKLKKTINCNYVSWALTDSDFTDDNKYMIHTTLSPNVQLFDIQNQKYLDQLNMDIRNEDFESSFFYYSFRLYTAKISSDGKQVIAGTSRSLNGKARIQVYDVEQKKLTNTVNAHENDINSIGYIDKKNSSLILTGSDDGLCKLWDIRALEGGKPAGIFYGHLSGITHLSSKEDNHYFISNSKDQSLKLWDLRKTKTEEKKYHHFGFDYRMEKLSATEIAKIKKAMKINPNDDSVSTFFGHQVYVSLVRCHFSPKYNTNQRFIYSGSSDGCMYIFDTLTTELVAKLEVNEERVIRDCAWHPTNQNIITTDFAGNICKWDHFDI